MLARLVLHTYLALLLSYYLPTADLILDFASMAVIPGMHMPRVTLCLVAEPQRDAVSQSITADVVPRPSRTSLKRSTSALRGTMQVLPPLSSSSDTRGEGEGGGRWLHDPISETPCAREAASRLFLPPGWCAQGRAAGRPAESGTTEVPGREKGRRVNGNRGAQGRQGKGGGSVSIKPRYVRTYEDGI